MPRPSRQPEASSSTRDLTQTPRASPADGHPKAGSRIHRNNPASGPPHLAQPHLNLPVPLQRALSAVSRHAFLLLVALTTSTVVFGLVITARLHAVTSDHLVESQKWTQRSHDYVSLRPLASNVKLAVNHRGTSMDRAEAEERVTLAVAALEAKARSLLADLAVDQDPFVNEITPDIERLVARTRTMGEHALANEHTSEMHEELEHIVTAITQVAAKVRTGLEAKGDAALSAAAEIGTWKLRAACATLPIIVGVGLAGFRLSRHLERVTLLAQTALRESAALRSTVDEHLLVSVSDSKGRIVEVNQRFCQISGYSREELLGQDHRLLNSGVQSKDFWDNVWRTLADGQPWRGEVCNRSKDGSLYWVDTIIAPFTGVSGRIEKYVSIRTDITALKQTQDALRHGEERWRGVMDSGMLAMFTWDVDGNILECNDAFLDTVGYSREDLRSGRVRWRDMTPPELAPRDELALREIAATGRCLPYQKEFLRKNGSRVPILLGAAQLSAGSADQGIAFAMDITDRRRAEDKALQAEEFLRNVIDSLSSHTVVVDPDGVIRSVNRAWREFAARNGGAGAGVLEGANYLAACDRAAPSCEQAAQVAIAIRSVLAGELAPPAIEYACHAPNEQRWFLCSIRGFALNGRRFAVISHLNTTAIKRAELELTQANQALAKSHTEVEERVIQRTAQLAEATEAAKAASRAKSEFLATMSHEIRTPLNGVVGTLELLQNSSLSAQQIRYLQIGKTSALSLTSVINDILDFSKIEAGKLELNSVDFDLRETVGDLMEMLAVRAAEKGLEMACSIEPTLPARVRGDDDRLRQVIINLVNNAIKFTERGAIVLRVEPVRGSTDGRLRFTVTDTGIGIPKDRLDRLFTPFSQADASLSRKYGGTGLGLAICKQLAELMGGGTGVESEPGRGSTFWFEAVLPAASVQPVTAPVDCRDLRLLLVEDHELQRQLIAECLTSLRFSADTAADGEVALEMMLGAAAAGRPFAAVLTDFEMPGMDGIELATAMQSRAELKSVPIILLSSALDLNPTRVRNAGFASHLTKPIRQSALLDAVMSAMAPRVGAITTALTKEPTPTAATPPPPQPLQQLQHSGSRPRLRVLLAEDNEINQMIACELLGRHAMDCTIAPNGVATVAAVAKEPFDLVLMDCHMPQMDGFEATREIRRQEQAGLLAAQKGRRLPIIALTANAIKGDRERCLEAGMDAYSTKPIDLKHLLAIIDSLVCVNIPTSRAA